MTGPRAERIRPCTRCGALMPYSSLRCGACGAGATGAAGDERVRPCLQCGVILRFDQDPCPRCGAQARPTDEPDRVKPCAACGEWIAFAALYCPRCRELSLPIAVDSIPPDVEAQPRESLAARAALAGAALGVAGGLALLAVAVLEILA